MENKLIKRLKLHESFMTSEKLNEIIDTVNALSPLYYSVQSLITSLKTAKDDHSLLIENFITQYGSIIDDTPNIVELLNSFGDYERDLYQNVFVGTTEEVQEKPIQDGQWLIEKLGDDQGIVYYDEGEVRLVISSGGNIPTITIDPISFEWLIDGVTTGISARSEVPGSQGTPGLPGEPARFYEFVSIDLLPTLASEGSNAHWNKAYLDNEGYLYFPQSTNNLTLSPARPYYKTSFSIHGDKGDKGEQGLKGDTGSGLVLKGFVTSWAALPTEGFDGDGYVLNLKHENGSFILDTEVGYLWVYNESGTTISTVWKPFKYVGPIQGERGYSVIFRVDSGWIQYKYDTDTDTIWKNVIELSALTGEAATIHVGTVTTAESDEVALVEVTPESTNQNKTLNFTLPKGKSIELQKNATHVQWRVLGSDTWIDLALLTDLQGPVGEAATVTVGTVVASEPGSSPVITESGTSQNKILNFTLPRGIQGTPGEDGQEVSLQIASGYIQWKLTDGSWNNLIELDELTGPSGPAGDNVELRITATDIEWKLSQSASWTFLIALSSLKGDTGDNGLQVYLQKTSTEIQWKLGPSGTWTTLVALSELKGDTGDTGLTGLSENYIGLFEHGDTFLKSELDDCRAVRIELQTIEDNEGADIRNITHASTTRDIENAGNSYYNYIHCNYFYYLAPATDNVLATVLITDSSNVNVNIYKTGLSTKTFKVRVFGIY